MENLFLTKNKNPKLDVFKNPRKKLIKEWIPINGNIGNWQADLLFLDNYKKYNHNYGIFLVLIEITSRFGVVYPLKKKSDTYEAFEKFIKIYKPTLIESDKGSEFVNNRLKKLFSDNSIKLYDTKIKTEVGVVERFNRTLRSLFERFIQLNGNYSFVDHLPEILKQYNNKVHSTTGYKPSVMHKNKELQNEFIFNQNQKIKMIKEKILNTFKPGDKIRKLINKELFDKGSIPKYSSEIYIIESVDPPYLKLSDGSSIHYRYVKLTTGETLSKPSISRKTLAKEKAVIQLHKRESIDEKNIITSKRQIKKPTRFISF